MRPVEAELENMVISMVQTVKSNCPVWADPERLSSSLGLFVHLAQQDSPIQGASVDNVVVLSSTGRSLGRQVFTFYHEILHHLIRRNEELYSSLHDHYEDEEEFRNANERLANIGAAEFMLPRQSIVEASHRYGYSLELLPHFLGSTRVSPTAVCVQLALSAPHRCIGLVARPSGNGTPSRLSPRGVPDRALITEVAVSSGTMKYRVGRNISISRGHLLHRVMLGDERTITSGKARIPFRNTVWEADCEAIRIHGQVFALFHVDPPRGPLR